MEGVAIFAALWYIGHQYETLKKNKAERPTSKPMAVETIRDPTAYGRSIRFDPDHGVKDMERFGLTHGDPDYYIWRQPDPRREHTEFDNFYWPKLFPRTTPVVASHYNQI